MAVTVDLSGKVALVTGGGTGLGAAAARILSAAGAKVYVTGRRAEPLKRAAAAAQAEARICDIAEDGAAWDLVRSIHERHGRFDILINAAGVAARGPAEDLPLSDVDYQISVNIRGLYQCCQAAGRVMRPAGYGKIVNVGSIASEIGTPNIAFYAATKGAVRQLTKSLAVEWAKDGVRVNAVLPGWFRTEMTVNSFKNEAFVSMVRARVPMGREAVPEEIEGAFLFLSSPMSDYVTGTLLPVDGGVLAG